MLTCISVILEMVPRAIPQFFEVKLNFFVSNTILFQESSTFIHFIQL